ncbi:MAG: hypothetical protein ABSF37_03850 [Sedimentisphaerales bacterium]|jgi:hypothetical protein
MGTKRKNEAVETLRKEAPGRVGHELIRAAGLYISNFPKQGDLDL